MKENNAMNGLLKKEIDVLVHKSWKKIAPFWPLNDLITINPLQGFEDLPIEQALVEGAAYFQQGSLPALMENINRQTIKWVQVFFDESQATISMPNRTLGFYAAWHQLACFDNQLHENDSDKKEWLSALPRSSEDMIAQGLFLLNIPGEQQVEFLTLLLTTLPGWAAHIKYRTEWMEHEGSLLNIVTQADYLAVRLVITCLLWPQAADLLDWHKKSLNKAQQKPSLMQTITKAEAQYQAALLDSLALQSVSSLKTFAAQIVFCIDIRSEPFRRALEATGNYETCGVAGFFGIPVRIHDSVSKESYASCPVLIVPKHTVKEIPIGSNERLQRNDTGYAVLRLLRQIYQSVKYTFTVPFLMIELLGWWSGVWMGIKSFVPVVAMRLKKYCINTIRPCVLMIPSLEDISFKEQCTYAHDALRMMGLVSNFSSLVVLCGHGSATENNAYAAVLNCGACGGHHGGNNARIMAAILNDVKVREYLFSNGIAIPEETVFIGAEHNTTTDNVELYEEGNQHEKLLCQLKNDFKVAGMINSQWRAKNNGFEGSKQEAVSYFNVCSADWSQVRPEWGLARNASFIVAPRELTKHIDLEGRSFLHSYDYRQDADGKLLTAILIAPMVVAQWINSQYLFSTIDNVSYGAGSKITHNITGKIGVMQGNASDLMTGLPLQSVYSSDGDAYHEPLRLTTIVYGLRMTIDIIIQEKKLLQKLFGNGWVILICIEPESNRQYFLQRDLTWK